MEPASPAAAIMSQAASLSHFYLHRLALPPAGTRTRVFRVRAEYPDQLDYRGGGWWRAPSFRPGNLAWVAQLVIMLIGGFSK